MGVCVALAGLRKRATVRRSRISDVLVFMKCYKIGYFVIMNILHRGAEPHLEAVPPPVGGLRVLPKSFISETTVPTEEGDSEACPIAIMQYTSPRATLEEL